MRRKLLITGFIALLLLISGITWLVSTQSGLNWLVVQTQKFVPELHIGHVEGQLNRSVKIYNLNYQPVDATAVQIDEISLVWSPSALFRSMLYVDSLLVDGITVNIVASEEKETDTASALPDIVLPIAVTLNDVTVNNVTLEQNDKTTPVLTSLTTSLHIIDSTLTINALQLERIATAFTAKGQLGLASPYNVALDYALSSREFTPAELVLKGDIEGDTEALLINQQTSQPFKSVLTARLTEVMDNLGWQAKLDADAIQLADMVAGQQTRINQLHFQSEGNLNAATASLSADVLQPKLPPVAISAQADSTDFESWNLELQTNLSETQFAHLQARIHTGELEAEGKLSWNQLQWPLTAQQPDYRSESGELMFSGSLENYQAALNAAVTVQQQKTSVALTASGNSHEVKLTDLVMQGFGGSINADGHINWQAQPMQYQFEADWQNLTLPAALTGKPLVIKHGNIRLLGSPEILSLNSQTEVMVDGIAASVEIAANGDYARGFDQTNLDVHLAQGSLNYQGQLYWQGETYLDGKLQLNKLNPGVLVAQWPGELTGGAAIEAHSDDNVLTANVKAMDIHGSLRQRRVSLTGSANYSPALIELNQLLLKTGQSQLLTDGTIKNNVLSVTVNVKSPDLSDFHPETQGSLKLNGKLAGSLKEPSIDAEISAGKLAYQQFSVGKVDGEIKLGLAANAELANRLQIQAIQTPQMTIDSLILALTGKQTGHKLNIAMHSEALDVSVRANGSWQNKIWKGRVEQFDFSNAEAGEWQLVQQQQISVSASSQSIPRHCWASVEGEICLDAQHEANQWQTAGSFKQVPLSLFEGFAAQLKQLKGSLRGDFALKAKGQGPISGHGEVYLDNASVKLEQEALNQKQAIMLNNTALKFTTDAQTTTASFHLESDLNGVSAIDASLQTAGLSTIMAAPEQAPLQGHITTGITDLSLLQLVHPAIEDLHGALHVNIGLQGTVGQPEVQGQAHFQNGQVRIVDAGILLKEIQLNVDGNLDSVDFDYHAVSGDGSLNGKGQFALTDDSWQLTTKLKAQQFELMNTPEMLIIAEPDLSITLTPALTKVTGKVHIPYAELEPQQFNSSVSPSSDVVVIREDNVEQTDGAVTEIDITVSLGDKVKLKAMGFQGRLEGQLRVSGNTSDILIGNGEIKIKEGSYLAYGQLLHVDNGSIRFAGNIENPELDIKAIRIGEDYKAGLHIEGNVSAPVATLFSEPGMDQDNILSYILLGKPIDQASATDAAILASAATGMGLQNGAMIGDQIANTFGLDEFSVGGDSAENAAVHVGKYLSPKLYLSYGIGVFEPVSTVELRYQLSKIWTLRAESGTESGIDLLYTIEKY